MTPAGTFCDKIVLVRATAIGIGDIRPTPFTKGSYPGVEIHANVLDNILNDNFLKRGFREEITDLALLLFCGAMMAFLVVLPACAAGRARPAAQGRPFGFAQGRETPARREDPERAITNVVRQMQFDLEASSRAGVLSHIDSAKFEDYPRFEDMIERLTRADTLRVYFRQANNSIQEDRAQTILDAEMELLRKDSAAPPERRRQQIVIDFERTPRGWRIVNITPRDFFRPL